MFWVPFIFLFAKFCISIHFIDKRAKQGTELVMTHMSLSYSPVKPHASLCVDSHVRVCVC